jgi:photosystem II stability/assembly factor-like uncharacterized protein
MLLSACAPTITPQSERTPQESHGLPPPHGHASSRAGLHRLTEVEGGDSPYQIPQSPDEVDQQKLTYPIGYVLPNAREAAYAAWNQLQQTTSVVNKVHVDWKDLGPAPLVPAPTSLPNMGPNSGRATAIAVAPNNPNVIFVGTALGGVWRTTNGGTTWKPTSDHEKSLAIGALAIDPQSPNTIYAGTGEANIDFESFRGAGILKSVDNGEHWTLIGASQFSGLTISKLVVDSSRAIYVSTQIYGASGSDETCNTPPADISRSGLFKSSDGGATWTQLIPGARISDFDIDPTPGPRKIVVALYRNTIATLDETTKTLTPATGVPAKVRRITLARATTNHSIMYAGIEQIPDADHDFAGVFRSVNGGASWTEVKTADGNSAPNFCKEQCVYDNVVTVDPTSADIVYLGGSVCSIWRMTDGTTADPKFLPVSMPGHVCNVDAQGDVTNWELDNSHPDVHALVFDPTDPTKLYVANDGGVGLSTDGGSTWTKLNDTLETLQFTHLCVDGNSGNVAGGARDNGSEQAAPGSLTWNGLWTGDGGGCTDNLSDPIADNQFALVSAQYGWIKRIDGKGNSQWNADLFDPTNDPRNDRAPYVNLVRSDPSNPQRVYVGTHRVWRSISGGAAKTWQAISEDVTAGVGGVACTNNVTMDDFLTALAVAPSASNVIYTASASGLVAVSKDDGAHWTKLTSAALPHRWATGLAVDPFDPDIVYVSYSGFSQATPNTPGHLFRSTDGGTTWSRVDTAIDTLDTPFEAVQVLPFAPQVLFVGTEFGVLVTIDRGTTWLRLGSRLPHVPVYDLAFDFANLRLVAATHGRGMWSVGLN